jgi:formylglycine-generating enzyme required for sulfatase activity
MSKALTTTVLLFAILAAGCSCDETPTMDAGADGSADGDTDSDTDSDSDTDTDTDADAGPDASEDSGPPLALEWIPMPGGTFLQGTVQGENNEKPAHTVNVPSFEMSRTETTVFQYEECVDAGVCSPPATNADYATPVECNWGVAGRGNHPVNCVNVYQAEEFCAFVGGRLASESEWEYAARGLGQDVEYPWGNEEPDCDKAVIRWLYDDTFIDGCGTGHTWPVCSKPAGNTPQGLCDMGGNVYEWVPDRWHVNYEGAPTDGSAWSTPPEEDSRVKRGGGFIASGDSTRCRKRGYDPQQGKAQQRGFRCARDWTGSPDGGVTDAGADGGV